MSARALAVALAAALALAAPAEAGRRGRRRPVPVHPPADTVQQTLHGEALLDPSLGDQAIDVCLAQTVEDVSRQYDAFAAACREDGGAPASDPAAWGTNLVSFNEVTLLCTLDVQASCARPDGGCRR